MSSRIIEECINLEKIEHLELPDNYTTLFIPKDTTMVIVDPHMINLKDLMNRKSGDIAIVRVRRPGWGNGNVKKYIHIIKT